MTSKLLNFPQKGKKGRISLDAILPDGSRKYFKSDFWEKISINVGKKNIVIVVDDKVRQVHPLGTQLQNVSVSKK